MERFFERVRPRLAVWVSARLGGALRARVEAEDIVQEILLKAWEALPAFEDRGGNSFYSWLFTIAEHRIAEWSDRYKAKKRAPEREEKAHSRIAALQTSPSMAAARREEGAGLWEAVKGLSPRYREILRLRRLEELSNEEAAARMKITSKNASVLYVRALEALRKRMA
jgi:RNA polymerase sigma-70 factor (ECF subfamily)